MYAHAFLPFLKYNIGAPMLSWIVVDMIRAGDRNGVVLGFIRQIGDELKKARGNLLFAALATNPKAAKTPFPKLWRDMRPKIIVALDSAI
jgi:hypothetical protein